MEIRNKNNNVTKVFAKTFEEEAAMQVMDLCNSSAYLDSKIRIMPDAHAGKGCVIGTTMTIKDKVTPNLVGVDIGCGMLCVKLMPKKLSLKEIDGFITNKIPHGHAVRKSAIRYFDLTGLKCIDSVNVERAQLSIGTLGGGNHFIEINKDDDGMLYLVIHSGSRNLGVQICNHYQKIAESKCDEKDKRRKEIISDLKNQGRQFEISAALNILEKDQLDKEIPYLSGSDFDNYINDMQIVQNFASINRVEIALAIIRDFNIGVIDHFETIHNYINMNDMILRKGSVSARFGEKILIPMNMRDGSLICVGKGNEDWNYSAPHGAGRLMSRSKAKEAINMDEFNDSMEGIYSTSVCRETLDEAPQVYKPMSEIIDAIKPTVRIIDVIKPIYNFKSK